MSSISDKLTAIYDIKNKIRNAIINKGGSLQSKAPFSSYPQAIYDLPVVSSPSDTYNYHPNPAWWDIKTILENDTPPDGYVAVVAFLMTDAPYSTILQGFDAYKCSDKDDKVYYGNTTHIWDTTKDKESGEGYKTRYFIGYVKTKENGSNRWLGKLLVAHEKIESLWSTPTACLGIVWNVPVFISLGSWNNYQTQAQDYSNNYICRLRYYTGQKSYTVKDDYRAIWHCNNSWNSVQYIDVTSNGKLIIVKATQAFSYDGAYRLPSSLRYIAPLYTIQVVYKSLVLDNDDNIKNLYINLNIENDSDIQLITSTLPIDLGWKTSREVGVYYIPPCLKNIEIHTDNKFAYISSNVDEVIRFKYRNIIGGRYYKYSDSDSSSYYYTSTLATPSVPVNIKLVVEENTIPLEHFALYPCSGDLYNTYKTLVYLPSLFEFAPLDYPYLINDNVCGFGITHFNIVNNTDSKVEVSMRAVYQFTGMPATELNALLQNYLQDRTGMDAVNMYITSSQNEKLTAETKQVIAERNWTLVVSS